jgi:hypothetical protein
MDWTGIDPGSGGWVVDHWQSEPWHSHVWHVCSSFFFCFFFFFLLLLLLFLDIRFLRFIQCLLQNASPCRCLLLSSSIPCPPTDLIPFSVQSGQFNFFFLFSFFRLISPELLYLRSFHRTFLLHGQTNLVAWNASHSLNRAPWCTEVRNTNMMHTFP